MAKIVVVALGVIRKGNRYLFTNRISHDYRDKEIVTNDFWQLPGGGLEFGESPEETCIREIKEETGLDVEVISVIPKICHDIRTQYNWEGIIIPYLCKMKDPHQPVILEAESTKYQWLSVEQAKNLNSFTGTISIIEAAERL